MDDNKEILNQNTQNAEAAVEQAAENAAGAAEAAAESVENAAENAAETVAEGAENAANAVTEGVENAAQTASSLTDPLEGAASQIAPEAPKKKKRLIQTPVIIAFVLVCAVALGFLVFKLFFNNDVAGTWVYKYPQPTQEEMMGLESTIDEADRDYVDYYFDFQNTAAEMQEGSSIEGAKVAKVTIGTLTYEGYYLTSATEEGSTLTVTVPNVMSGSFDYELSGNMFTGRELKLISPYADQTQGGEGEFIFKSATYSVPKLEREGEFKPDDKLFGKWVYDDGTNILTYDFKEDGSAHYTEKIFSNSMYGEPMVSKISLDALYTCEDGNFTLFYYYNDLYITGKANEMAADYSFDGDKLLINGLEFVREGASTADSAKQS